MNKELNDGHDLQTSPSDPVSNLLSWVNTSPSGAKFTYHTGFLCKDRDPSNNKNWSQINQIANIAWTLYEKGTLVLTQRKLKVDQYQYIAIKASR
jgi:hypothetical protein